MLQTSYVYHLSPTRLSFNCQVQLSYSAVRGTSASLVNIINPDSNGLELSLGFNVFQVDFEILSTFTGPGVSSLGPSTSILTGLAGEYSFPTSHQNSQFHSLPSIGHPKATIRAEMHRVDQLLLCRKWLKATTLTIAYSIANLSFDEVIALSDKFVNPAPVSTIDQTIPKAGRGGAALPLFQ
jgi:hypothetical protein